MPDSSSHATGSLQVGLTAGLLAAALLLGGGQGGLGDTVVQLLSLGLLGFLFTRSDAVGSGLLSARSPLWPVILVLTVPLIQMLPIPLWLWNDVAVRAGIAEQLSAVGLSPDPHLSLQPLAAERALWSLLPAVALYLSTSALPARQQRRLVGLVLVIALVSLVLGLLQIANGPDSALRFYANTNRTEAVGFFANRNHLAGLLLMSLPLSLALVAAVLGERNSGKPVGALAIASVVGLAVLLILGVALTRSRAGVVLGMLGLLLSAPMVLSLRRRRGVKRVFGIIAAAALLLTVQFALYGILQRLQADPLGDQRWQIAQVTREVARQNAPTGSGLGSFRQEFQTLDTRNPGPAIVNHAHDDYLELWLEAGWIFIAVAAGFVTLLLWAGFRAWRSQDRDSSLWAKAASISLLLMLLHSIVDYPLRTTANLAVFAVMLSLLLSWRRGAASIANSGSRKLAGTAATTSGNGVP